MKARVSIAAAVVAAGAFTALPAASQVIAGFTTDLPPPPPQVEIMPTARDGQIWAPGYYTWRENSYVWVPGHWEPARRGYRYVGPRWIEENGRYRYTDEQWVRDEDHTYGRDAAGTKRER